MNTIKTLRATLYAIANTLDDHELRAAAKEAYDLPTEGMEADPVGAVELSDAEVDTMINGIGGGIWKNGDITFDRRELAAVIRGCIAIATSKRGTVGEPVAYIDGGHNTPTKKAICPISDALDRLPIGAKLYTHPAPASDGGLPVQDEYDERLLTLLDDYVFAVAHDSDNVSARVNGRRELLAYIDAQRSPQSAEQVVAGGLFVTVATASECVSVMNAAPNIVCNRGTRSCFIKHAIKEPQA